MKKVLFYSLLILGLSASIGSCKLFKGGKDRCPAYTSLGHEVADDLALNNK